MVSSIIILILIKVFTLDITQSQVELQLPESYVVDVQHLIGGKNSEQPGVYGTKGQFSSLNVPGAREKLSMCINPLNGNILVFGGNGMAQDRHASGDPLNDLWEYDINLKRWKWISGSDTVKQPGYYGQLNVAAPENVPGARQGHAMVSDPFRKSVWIYGGDADRYMPMYFNDLWEWQSESELWIWRSGNGQTNQPVVYEANPLSGIQASPGARFGHAMVIHYETSTLVLFGGQGFDENGINGMFNDLWYFRISESQWSCPSRGDSVNEDVPTKRYHHSLSIHQSKNLIYMFGGSQNVLGIGINIILHSDLWAWNTRQKIWTRLSESIEINQKGLYGNISEQSRPGGRYGHSMSIHEDTGQFVVSGGKGYDLYGLVGWLNDLWIYEPGMGWKWIGGSSTVDQYGIYQKPFQIGSRFWHSIVYSQKGETLYLFGGIGNSQSRSGYLNDLWNINISITCPEASAKYGLNCVPCKAGTVVDGDSCIPCPEGYFSTDPANPACTSCPKNQYQPFKGQSGCLNCPLNAACALSEFQCLSGFTKNVNDATCIPCSAGYWKPDIGNHKCTQCLDNAMICEPTRCLLHNGRMCPLVRVSNFWIDSPIIGLSILVTMIWNFFVIGVFVGLKEPWFYSYEPQNTRRTQSTSVTSIESQSTLTELPTLVAPSVNGDNVPPV